MPLGMIERLRDRVDVVLILPVILDRRSGVLPMDRHVEGAIGHEFAKVDLRSGPDVGRWPEDDRRTRTITDVGADVAAAELEQAVAEAEGAICLIIGGGLRHGAGVAIE